MRGFLLLLFVACTLAHEYGADTSSLVSESGWSCLKSQRGVSFAVIRCFMETGAVDPNCASAVHNARAAGLKTDVYFFPALRLGANASVDQFARDVSAKGISFGRVWLDIEKAEWTSCAHNVPYVFDLYHRLREKGFRVGIYSNSFMWSSIMCNAKFKDAPPLWYAHYESPPNPSFSDFKPFASWSAPFAKQYEGGHTNCGVNYDANWTPNVF